MAAAPALPCSPAHPNTGDLGTAVARAGATSRAYGWIRVKGLTQNKINCNNVFSALIHFFFPFPSLTLSSLIEVPPSRPTLCQDFPAPTELALSSKAGLTLHRQTPHLDEHIFIFSSGNTHLQSPFLTWTRHPNRGSFRPPFPRRSAFPLHVCARPLEGIWVSFSIAQKDFLLGEKYSQSSRAALLRRLLHGWSSSSLSGDGPDSSLRFVFPFPGFSPGPGSRGMCSDGRGKECLVLRSGVSAV